MGTATWEHMKQDAVFGVRLLLKNRTFALMAIVTMALAIGSTTAVFSLIDGILIRPLPFAEPDRLFDVGDIGMRGPFDTLRSNSRLSDYAAHLGIRAFNVKGRNLPDRLMGSEVSANLFQVLGATPLMGQTFPENGDRPGRTRVAILSHDLWLERYGGRTDAVGQQLVLDEEGYRIVGVMPAGFRYPSAAARFWIPMTLNPNAIGEYWGSGGVSILARLRPGISSKAAASELQAWIPRIRRMFPWRMPDAWGQGAALTPLKEHLTAGAKVRSLLLLGAVGLVLTIALVNVANLLMGQAAAREREFAMRASLGATAARLAQQMFTEALMLATAGGLCGTALAFGQLALLKKLLPPDTPRLADLAIDGGVLAFTAVITLGSGFFFGLLPVWRLRTQGCFHPSESNRTTAGRPAMRADGMMVAAEAAFATVLLVGAGLLLHSFRTMLKTDVGFQVKSVVTAELSPNPEVASSLEKTVALFERVRARLAAYPGVASVAAMNVLPLTPEYSMFTAAIEDHLRPPQEPQIPLWSTAVTPEHLNTLGIHLLQGRGFTGSDGASTSPVVLISRATARRYWPDRTPIGKHLRPVWQSQWRTVVGVVEDVKQFSITGPPAWVEGEVYLPMTQAIAVPRTFSLAIRVAGNSQSFEGGLPGMMQEICANCAISKIARMDAVVSSAMQAPRSMAWLVGSIALLALGMAAAGIYGVVSHAVLRRTREMGVRLALGASRNRIGWLVFCVGLRHTMLGTAAGLMVSWVAVRWIRTLLYGLPEHDLVSFSVAPVVIAFAAIFASWMPMWRAMRIDPARSLREG